MNARVRVREGLGVRVGVAVRARVGVGVRARGRVVVTRHAAERGEECVERVGLGGVKPVEEEGLTRPVGRGTGRRS
jgi:hypothetical protein